MTDADLAAAGMAAVVEGVRLFYLDVQDPSSLALARGDLEATRWRSVIDQIHKDAGWGSETPYRGNRVGREWCGFFVAACWRTAGIDPKWLATYWASTYRLGRWGSYQTFDDHHPNPPPAAGVQRRLMAKLDPSSSAKTLPFVPREGDIVVIGDGSPPDGDHITLCVGFDPAKGIIRTVEGNGIGNGPDGKRREGIVMGERKIGGQGYCVRRIYRPAPGDLT